MQQRRRIAFAPPHFRPSDLCPCLVLGKATYQSSKTKCSIGRDGHGTLWASALHTVCTLKPLPHDMHLMCVSWILHFFVRWAMVIRVLIESKMSDYWVLHGFSYFSAFKYLRVHGLVWTLGLPTLFYKIFTFASATAS